MSIEDDEDAYWEMRAADSAARWALDDGDEWDPDIHYVTTYRVRSMVTVNLPEEDVT